jgi:hypothetical protein
MNTVGHVKLIGDLECEYSAYTAVAQRAVPAGSLRPARHAYFTQKN